MLKKIINDLMKSSGYQFCKVPFSERQIKGGHFKWLQEMGISTVIDVGANNGGFAGLINKILPDVSIYSFEPLKDCFNELKINTSNIKNIKYFNYALGSEESEQIMNHNEFAPSSSLLNINEAHTSAFPFTAKTVPEKIIIKRLDSFLDEIQIRRKVLLKIDVQGYEINVLDGAPEFLKSTDLIIVETSFFQLYDGQPLFHDVYTKLYESGFRYHGNFDQLANPVNNQILQADAVFLRKF